MYVKSAAFVTLVQEVEGQLQKQSKHNETCFASSVLMYACMYVHIGKNMSTHMPTQRRNKEHAYSTCAMKSFIASA